jgi:predicted methyltransferase
MQNKSLFSLRGLPGPALALCLALATFGSHPAMATATDAPDLQPLLTPLLNSPVRSAVNRARDQFRHPVETLNFFQVRRDMTLIEIIPGYGWYAEILAPLLRDHGQYIAAMAVGDGLQERLAPANAKRNVALKAEIAANPATFDKAKVIEFAPAKANLGPDGSADVVLTFRNAHNWVEGGTHDTMFKAMFAVLKPGGILGVVDHRGLPGKSVKEIIDNGYLPEAYLIAQIEKAGFKLDAKSEINANPKDTKDYPRGVWTLPPIYLLGEQDRARYTVIGESDRFTLRFVKPAK